MSWLFSQALVEEYSAGTCLAGKPCAQLNVMPTQHKFWRNDKTMDFSALSRFGLTSQLLTDAHGQELLTSYLQGFPAKTSALPAQERGSKANEADFGFKYVASFAKCDPSAGSGWRTRQCSLLGDLAEFSETWPNWGLMRNGECWERTTPVLPTSERGSGFWPTPVATMSKGSSPGALTRKNGRDRSNDRLDHAVMAREGGRLNPDWTEWLMAWPIGWTDLKPLATDRFREWQQQHGRS